MEKMYTFVEQVWSAYIDKNKSDIRHVLCIYMYSTCFKVVVFREIDDEETSDIDGDREEVKDGTVLPEEESGDDI